LNHEHCTLNSRHFLATAKFLSLQWQSKIHKEQTTHQLVPFIEESLSPPSPTSLTSVDIYYSSNGIKIMDASKISSTPTQTFLNRPPAQQNLRGNIHSPPDNRKETIITSKHGQMSNTLHRTNGVSFNIPNATHAWILSTGNIANIASSFLPIIDTGPVEGYSQDLSSVRGELQGQTALAIVANMFLSYHSATQQKVHLLCDNKGVINQGYTSKHDSHCHERGKYIDTGKHCMTWNY
jgi:hypothetical protein